jgi:hypothetical protein
MMEDFWIVEVFYNKEGAQYNPNAEVVTPYRYHSKFYPVIAKDLEEVENKIKASFAVEKPEYKIFKIEVQRTL